MAATGPSSDRPVLSVQFIVIGISGSDHVEYDRGCACAHKRGEYIVRVKNEPFARSLKEFPTK